MVKYVICKCTEIVDRFTVYSLISPQLFPVRKVAPAIIANLTGVKILGEISFEINLIPANILASEKLVSLSEEEIANLMPEFLRRYPKEAVVVENGAPIGMGESVVGTTCAHI